MSTHNPIGACCARPRFNGVGGIDDPACRYELTDSRRGNGAVKYNRAAIVAAGILAALAIVYAFAVLIPGG